MTQRGNILFLILLAVVLFAALSYAVTQSLRGGGKDASAEDLQVQAADLIQYFSLVDTAVMRMTMSQNIRPENLSFSHTSTNYVSGVPAIGANVDGNANCTTNTCQVFHTDGGGVPSRIFEQYGDPPSNPTNGLMSGNMRLYVGKWPGAGTDLPDLFMRLIRMKPEICAEVNRQMGITNLPTSTGTQVVGNNPSTWDTGNYVMISNELITKHMYATANAGYCDIHRLVLSR